jgi:hypothetical protein
MKLEKAYTIHITRRQDWFDKKNYNAISLAEWISYVKSDPQMELINGYDIKLPGETISVKYDGLSLWKVHSNNGEIVFNVFFGHNNGNIEVKNPDNETIKKMITIAGRLDANVQGDKGELYDRSFFPPNQPSKPWWKFW